MGKCDINVKYRISIGGRGASGFAIRDLIYSVECPNSKQMKQIKQEIQGKLPYIFGYEWTIKLRPGPLGKLLRKFVDGAGAPRDLGST